MNYYNMHHLLALATITILALEIIATEQEQNYSYLKWINDDDWITRNATSIIVDHVTDSRWNEFDTIETDYLRFVSVASISFSVYSPDEIEFYIADDDYIDYLNIVRRNIVQKWINFTIFVENNNVYISENGHVIKITNQMVPEQIVVKSPNKNVWKIHEYLLRWSNSITPTKETSEIKFTHHGKFSLILYTLLCKQCILEFTLLSGKEIKQQREIISNHSNFITSWKSNIIEFDANDETEIIVKRKITDESVQGFWGLDFKLNSFQETRMVVGTSKLAIAAIVAVTVIIIASILCYKILSQQRTTQNYQSTPQESLS